MGHGAREVCHATWWGLGRRADGSQNEEIREGWKKVISVQRYTDGRTLIEAMN